MIEYKWHFLEDDPNDLPPYHKEVLTLYKNQPDLASVPFCIIPAFRDDYEDFREVSGLFNMKARIITKYVLAWTDYPELPERYNNKQALAAMGLV